MSVSNLSGEHQSWQPRRVVLMDRANNYIANDHGSLVTVTYLHDVMHRGCLFEITNGVTLATTSDTFVYLIQTGSIPIHFLFSVSASGEANFMIYEGTTFSAAGTAVTPINLNRTSANTLTLTTTHTPTVTTDGTLLATHHIGTGRITGGSVASASEFVLATNEDYLLRVTTEGNSNDIDMEFLLYEQTV